MDLTTKTSIMHFSVFTMHSIWVYLFGLILFYGQILESNMVSIIFIINPLYTGGLFHYPMLDESICHFRGVRPSSTLNSIFGGKSC